LDFALDNVLSRPTANMVRHVRLMLGREALVADLTADNLERLYRHATEAADLSAAQTDAITQHFRRAWRAAIAQGILPDDPAAGKNMPIGSKPGSGRHSGFSRPGSGRHRVQLSDAEGTAWHVCLKQYFPRSTRITHPDTREHYEFALRELRKVLGREPLLEDLTDDNCIAAMNRMRDRGCAAETTNGVAAKLRALMTWLAKRRLIPEFPTFQNFKEPKRIPRAWTREQLDTLLVYCGKVRGQPIGGAPAAAWWTALHLLIWDCGARIGETLAIRKEWLDWQTGDLLIPAEYRKGQEADASYRLHADTLAALRRIQDNGSDLLFGGVEAGGSLYYRYERLLRDAGLEHDRKSKFHRLRRSVASHLQANGHSACDVLGHSTPQVTRDSYLDPRIVGATRPSEVLFRPGAGKDCNTVLQTVSAKDRPTVGQTAELAEAWL
jgi:integrase